MSQNKPDVYRILGGQPLVKTVMGKHLLDGILPEDNGEQNLFPQLFIYSFDARYEPETPVEVKIYISDFYDTVYVLDKELYFDVRVEIDRNVEIHENIRGGDYSINFGTLPYGEHHINFQVIDKLGRKSQRIYHTILVSSSYISPEETYIATLDDLNTYNITLGLTYETATEQQMKNNRLGLSNLVNDTASNGYRKLILPEGLYRIMKSCRDVGDFEPDNPLLIMPTNFTLDLNNSTIKLHPFVDIDYRKDGKSPTNATIYFRNCTDSHLINGTFEGDWVERQQFRDRFSSFEGEGTNNIGFSGQTKYCSMRGVTVKGITGYNLGTGIFGDKLTRISGWVDNISINEETGGEEVSNDYTTSALMNLDKYLDGEYIAVNPWLGYGGIKGKEFMCDFSFYDSNNRFIEQIQMYQHRRCRIPLGAKFARFTIKATSTEANSVTGLSLHNHPTPKGTLIEDCHFIDNRTCAAPAQFQHFTFRNCKFTRSGSSITPCAIDLEDGWEQMQDFFMVNNEIVEKSGSADLIINAGLNHHIEGNKGWRMILRYSIRSLAVLDNINSTLNNTKGWKTGYTQRFYDNELTGLSFGETEPSITYTQVLKNNTLNIGYTNKSATAITGGTLGIGSNSNLTCVGVTIYKNENDGHYANGNSHFKSCKFIGTKKYPTYTIHLNRGSDTMPCTWKECTFIAPTHMRNHNYFFAGLWSDCAFMDTVLIEPAKEIVMGKVKFENCVFEKLVTYNTAKIQFNNCVFKQGVKCTGVSQAQFNNCTGI